MDRDARCSQSEAKAAAVRRARSGRSGRQTVWVMGDQLNRSIASLRGARPSTTVVLMIRSRHKISSRPWHRQRLHAVLTAMARFGEELRAEGFEVDLREAATFAEGLAGHRRDYSPRAVKMMAPESIGAQSLARAAGVELVDSNMFLTSKEEFIAWAGGRADGRGRLKMEDFYRWQRRRLGVLMEGDKPLGGRWNFDHDNRLPPPRHAMSWPEVPTEDLDQLDEQVGASLPPGCVGEPPKGWWPTSRQGALRRLAAFVERGLELFGPYEDAMLADQPRMAHSMLSQALNLGLLHPQEVVEAIESAYRSGRVSLSSAEGMIRQVMGWREYVRGVYWLWGSSYRNLNALDAHRMLPPALTQGATSMRCVQVTVRDVLRNGWVHHIQRLMVLSNLCTLAGVDPEAVLAWMWENFVDAAEWVMVPNVLGMGLHADGGRMATKPYVSGGAYINRMSDYCRSCRYDPKRRVGDDACPFTTLYWAFLDRHRDVFVDNVRMARQVRSLGRLEDLAGVRARAEEVLVRLDEGSL